MKNSKPTKRVTRRLGLALLAAWLSALPVATRGDTPAPASHPIAVTVKEIPATVFVGVSRELMPDEIHTFQLEAVALLDSALASSNLRRTGPLHFMGPSWNGPDKKSVFIIGYPVSAAANFAAPAPLRIWTEPAQRTAILTHTGPASTLSAQWEHLSAWAIAQKLAPNGHWCEVFHRFGGLEAADNQTELQLGLTR